MRNTREGGYSNILIHKRNKTGVSNIHCGFWVCSKRNTTTGPAKKHGGEDLEQVTRFDHSLMATLRSMTSKRWAVPENLCQTRPQSSTPNFLCFVKFMNTCIHRARFVYVLMRYDGFKVFTSQFSDAKQQSEKKHTSNYFILILLNKAMWL